MESVRHALRHRGAGETRDRKYRPEHRLQALVQPPADRLVHHQELVVGRLLNLDEVRHLGDFLDVTEELANAFATGECLLRHRGLSFRRPSWANLPKRDCPRPRVEFRIASLEQSPNSGIKSQTRSPRPPNAKRRPGR